MLLSKDRSLVWFVLTFIAVIVMIAPVFSKIIEVPKDNGSIADAVTAAVAGDTILIAPGFYSGYNSSGALIEVAKRLIIIGSGYKSVPNGGTHVTGGFNLTATADKTKIMGIRFIGVMSGNVTVQDGCNQVVITNNYFPNTYYAAILYGADDTVRYNLINGCVYLDAADNAVITNNIITGGYQNYLIYPNNSCPNLKIVNNVLGQCYSAIYDAQTPASILFYGNIMYKMAYGVGVYNYNLALYTGNWKWNCGTYEPPNGYDNGAGDPKFVNFDGNAFTYNDDLTQQSDLHLTDTSPCIDYSAQAGVPPVPADYVDINGLGGKGTARVDCGIYGGPFPFPDSFGAPNLPAVFNMTINPSPVSPGGTINLNVEGAVGKSTRK